MHLFDSAVNCPPIFKCHEAKSPVAVSVSLQHDLGVDDLPEAAKGVLKLALVRLPRQAAHEDPTFLLPLHRRRSTRERQEQRLGFGEKRRLREEIGVSPDRTPLLGPTIPINHYGGPRN